MVLVVVLVPAGGREITWLPTVWVYRMGVDLVTVTFGTGIDLEAGGCWKFLKKFLKIWVNFGKKLDIFGLTILIADEEAFNEDTTLVAVVRETC